MLNRAARCRCVSPSRSFSAPLYHAHRQQTRRFPICRFELPLQIQPSPAKLLVGIHSMHSRHPRYRCTGLQRLLDDSTLLLHGAKSPTLSTPQLNGLRGSVHDSPLWTRSLCPQRSSFMPTHTSSRRSRFDAYEVWAASPISQRIFRDKPLQLWVVVSGAVEIQTRRIEFAAGVCKGTRCACAAQ